MSSSDDKRQSQHTELDRIRSGMGREVCVPNGQRTELHESLNLTKFKERGGGGGKREVGGGG